MKINFSKEILVCFKLQYPKRFENYKDFFVKEDRDVMKIQKYLLIYCDMIEDFNILIKLIKELKNESITKKTTE